MMKRASCFLLAIYLSIYADVAVIVAQDPDTASENESKVIIVPQLTGVETSNAFLQTPPKPTSAAIAREIVQYEAYAIPQDINPLTGLRADPDILARRPLVVKVSNAPASVRPQAGIGSADVVIEHLVESGLTRLSAIFYGETPERVGSVRSARLIDTDILRMYDGMLAYSGGSQGVRDNLYNNVPYRRIFLDGVSQHFERDWNYNNPHNLFALPADIWGTAASLGESMRPSGVDGVAFRTLAPTGAFAEADYLEVKHISLKAEWFYDMERRQYLRYTDGIEHGDRLTGKTIAVENVLVVFAYHELSDIVEDVWNESVSYGHKIHLVPTGDLLLFRDGQIYQGFWQRPMIWEQMRFLDAEGNSLYIKPGKSWIHIVKLENQMRRDMEWVRWE